ncbi:NIT2 [Candida oxycetoniae]|uniref:NIT2 n=1 Tax=Candida oxycetoniae TaxID=497107 RepID=A0AAI9X0E5_9ASCO|nr:NIT2 [Candida oxycetoniae]KAI3406925.1 NIT2 [Candida oxycetoniae]
MRVSVGQLCSSASLTRNLHVVYKILNQAIQQKSQILFLPEATDYISQNALHSTELAKQVESSFLQPLLNHIKKLKSSTYVSVGVHLPGGSARKVRNVHLLIDPQGKIVCEYQKIHLFDVDVPNGPILKESNAIEPGNQVTAPFHIPNTKFNVGLAICYDIRFPELSLKLRQLGANILTFPSAFTTKTGQAHWEILSRSRALDTQCFVINAAQCGQHDVGTNLQGDVVKRVSYGESIIVDPWGRVLARGRKFDDELKRDVDDDYYEVITSELDIEELEKIRINMPLLEHRRGDMF